MELDVREAVGELYEKMHEGYMEVLEWLLPWDRSWHVVTVGSSREARRAADRVEAVAGPVRGRSVVEVGAGTGLLAVELALRGARLVLAVDVDPFFAALYLREVFPLVARLRLPVLFAVGDAFALRALPQASFDVGVYVGRSLAEEFRLLLERIARRVVVVVPEG